MQRIEYRTIDKSQWGEGPWQDEPDEIRWIDEETRYPCVILRGPAEIGHLCGYVGVPKDNHAHGKGYDNVDVDVHGGLTYSDKQVPKSEPNGLWWLGFDCAHLGDLTPGLRAALLREPPEWAREEAYRDIAYVTAQCQRLAKQLKAMEK